MKVSQMIKSRRNALLTAVLVCFFACLLPAQQASDTRMSGEALASLYDSWSIAATSTVPAPGSSTVTLADSTAVLSNNEVISPISINAPLLISDGTRSEVVVPSATDCHTGETHCSFTATFAFSHLGHFTIRSGTHGLQEAIRSLGTLGGIVILPSVWTGSATDISAATGSTTVLLKDQRNGQITWYAWNQGHFQPIFQLAAPVNNAPASVDLSQSHLLLPQTLYTSNGALSLPATPDSLVGSATPSILESKTLGSASAPTTDIITTHPWTDVRAFGASGSSQQVTGTADSSSAVVSLDAAGDFQNGQGVAVLHAGAATSVETPTELAATVVGTPGTTTYSYQVAAIDALGGESAATSTVSVSNGPAQLDRNNYISVTWQASQGTPPVGYVIYGDTGGQLRPLALIGGQNTFYHDYGTAPDVLPDTIAPAPPSAPLHDTLVAAIVSGAGTQQITLTQTSSVTDSGLIVKHDDTAAIQRAVDSGANVLYLPPGTYNVGQINIGTGVRLITGSGTLQQQTAGTGIISATGAQDLRISGLHFHGVGANDRLSDSDNAITLTDSTDITIDHNLFEYLPSNAVMAFNSSSLTIVHNSLHHDGQGIYLRGVQDASINGNQVDSPLGSSDYFTTAVALGSTASGAYQHNESIIVAGNRIRGYQNADSILVHDGAKISIANNTIDDALCGICLGPASSPDTVNHLLISGNTVVGTSQTGAAPGLGNYGILLTGANNTLLITDALVSGNQVRNGNAVEMAAGQGCIGLGYVDDVVVNGNFMSGCYFAGISMMNPSTRIDIGGNTIDDIQTAANISAGIVAYAGGGSQAGIIQDNLINNAQSGIEIDAPSPSLHVGTNSMTNTTNRIVNPANASTGSIFDLLTSPSGSDLDLIPASGTARFTRPSDGDTGIVVVSTNASLSSTAGLKAITSNGSSGEAWLTLKGATPVGWKFVAEDLGTTPVQIAGQAPSQSLVIAPSGQTALKSLAIGGDAAMSSAPRSVFSVFLPSLQQTGTVASWTPDKPLVITRIQTGQLLAPAGCGQNAILTVSQGSNSVTLPITAAINDSGPITFAVSAGSPVGLSISQPATGCTVYPSNLNALVQYRMN